MTFHTITFLLCIATSAAQVATSIALPLAIEAPDLRDGLHAVTVRWYDVPVSGTCIETEQTSIDIQSGKTTLALGLNSPLPDALLQGGHAWISIAFRGMSEPSQRVELLPMAFAQTSAYALVAASLDPRATGIVTSLNELAGAVEVVGEEGVSVTRKGRQIVLSSTAQVESGSIGGDAHTWEFIVRPATSSSSMAMICAVESPHDAIDTTWRFDAASGCFIIATSAVLQPDETLHWTIRK